MAFNPYDTLPVADEALDKGGVELLRAGLAEQELYVTLRRGFEKPDRWGGVLADVTLHLAALYSKDGELTKGSVIALVAQTYGQALRKFLATAERRRPGKSARPPVKTPARKAKALARSKAKAPARLKARSKTAAKAKSAGKAVAGHKGRR
jgi:hypothetical protein